MTYEELKTKINDLPHTRFRAQIVNDLNAAAKHAGYEHLFDFVLHYVRAEVLKPHQENGIPHEVNRAGLVKYFGLTRGQISGATYRKKLKCTKQGRFNIYLTSQEYLQEILRRRLSKSLFDE